MGKSLRVAYGEALVKLGAKNDKVVALDADLAHATMSATFAQEYPDRFYNMGIAEADMMLYKCKCKIWFFTFWTVCWRRRRKPSVDRRYRSDERDAEHDNSGSM